VCNALSGSLWLALVAGNSRLHWACFENEHLTQQWDTPPLSAEQFTELQERGFTESFWQTLNRPSPPGVKPYAELWIASVVRSVVTGLRHYPALKIVDRELIPINHLYETIGVDRALTLLGAGITYGWPVLVVDGGTAMTFTAGILNNRGQATFLGGAILPGLGLQFRALQDYTDQLPWVDYLNRAWPERWATNTADAMTSGIFHTLMAGVQDFLTDWWRRYPNGRVVFTGGDGATLAAALDRNIPNLKKPVYTDPNLMFWGLQTYRQTRLKDR
jgi:type III pantothenate kinase